MQNKSNGKPLIFGLLTSIIIIGVGAFSYSYFNKASTMTNVVDVNKNTANSNSSTSAPVQYQAVTVNVPFEQQKIDIKPEISQKFSISEIKNIHDMEKAYGFKFTPAELSKLEQNKFIVKNLLDTNLTDGGLRVGDNVREFAALYRKIAGDIDYKNRTQANSVFISSDSMMNLFSILSADLLKETENKYLFDQTASMTKVMYDQVSIKLQQAKTDDEKNQWNKVRNYFAVPYALLSTYVKPVNPNGYWDNQEANGMSVDDAQADYKNKDKDADSFDKASNFVKNLKIGSDNETAVLADIKQVYDASEQRGKPKIFESEITAAGNKIDVKIPFTLFKPRGTYTSSSLRRQYFRAVQWYQQIPFLLGSDDLTKYAIDIGELVNSSPDVQNQYKSFQSFIAYIVGESDDLDVRDYSAAFNDLGSDKAHDLNALKEYLAKRKPLAKIKSMPVNIDPLAGVTVADELAALSGMRFMSQKFIPDSYWTSKLTQGDEAPAVDGQSLSDQASELEVMSILGSPYATTHLTDLPFYSEHKKATDTKLAELKSEANGWGDSYWQSNLYTNSLWTITGMFSWLSDNHSKLPQFMQSPLWDSKTLLTSAGFWTELRHTTLLYAKQSFAEMGGGGSDACDLRKVPEPAKGYIEPQAVAYDRLNYTANRLLAEYNARGFKLSNLDRLENYIKLLSLIREYTKLELENNLFSEKVIDKTRHSDDDNKDCVEHLISPESKVSRKDYGDSVSRWEEIRLDISKWMLASLPSPIEGPILQIKDKRAAVVADIHTDKSGGVLEEGTGVPRVIFVAVKDANGPRLTIGFTYSQYETISAGNRLTDEEWQKNFYTDAGGDNPITYKPKNTWPDINLWFQDLLGKK